jgi:hypothetical protein
MSNVGLFFLGALGALLTVYLAKQEVIPEFRLIFDTADMEKEVRDHQDHIKKTEKDIDDIQGKLREESVPTDLAQRLTTVLSSSLSEVQAERERVENLERGIMRSKAFSRSLGFLSYIVLGGVFGFLLAGKIKVEGLSGDLPVYFQSIVIGATWTTYLSTIGIRSGQDKADNRIEAVKKEAGEKIEALKNELTPKVAEKVAAAEKAEKVQTPILAGEVEKMMVEKIDWANKALQKKLDETRQMVKRDVKGLL